MRRAALVAALLLAGCAPQPPQTVAAFAYAAPPAAPSDAAGAPTPRPLRSTAPIPPAPRTHRIAIATEAGGALCGDPRLVGALAPEVVGRGPCGIVQPVRLSAVAGVRLTRPVTVGCDVARALADWTATVAQPAAQAHMGAALKAMTPFAGYACRPTNSQPGAKISRHAMGQAVDIGAFTLADGREVSVLDGWRGRDAPFLKAAWRGACGPFGTVLGPDADRYHRNHLHLDVARYRSGPHCR